VLHADSAPGRGTTMRVLLPLAPEGEDAARSSKGTSTPRPSGGRETILLAEDEPSLRALVTATLSELGYRVVAAADGAQAVREFERLGPEVALVLLDVVMPHLDARQAYERILAIRPDARVLFMTGYAPESTRLAQLVETGRVDLLEKPFTPEALAAKVRSMLDARVTAARSARA
jgi:CheY-like chemotaxis protein